jgi:hypothetical protein
MGKRRTWKWVTRDPEAVSTWHDTVVVWEAARPRPGLNEEGVWDTNPDGEHADYTPQEFKERWGLTIPADRPVKVEFTARIIE